MIATQVAHGGIEPAGRRRRAYLATSLATVMSVIDGTIANTALPTIARELHVSPAATVWVVNAFNLAVTAALFAAGGYAASLGLTRVYRTGVIVFTAGSLLCALSPTFAWLVSARVLQGVGAAMIMAMSPAIVRSIFPVAQLVRAFGYNAVVVSAAGAAGPTVGGLLLAVAPWPWLFAINLPIAVAAVLIGRGALPEAGGTGVRPDMPSIAASALGFSLLVYGVDGFSRNEAPPVIAVESIAGAVVFGWFVRRQFVTARPIIALDLFRIPIFRGAASTSFVSWTAYGIGFVTLPFVLQIDRGISPLVSGLLLTAWPLGTALSAPFASRWADRMSVRVLASAGLGVFGVALAGYAATVLVAPPLLLLALGGFAGIGFGLFQAPNNGELLGSAPIEKSASASTLLATMRVGAQTLGGSLVAIVFALAERRGDGASFVHAAAPVTLGMAAVAAFIAMAISVRREVRTR